MEQAAHCAALVDSCEFDTEKASSGSININCLGVLATQWTVLNKAVDV